MGPYSPSADVILTEMDDGTGVLLHMRTKFYYALNESGVFAWKALEQDRRLGSEDLAALIHKDFDVDLASARSDVERLLAELLEEELIVA
jgi:hypothetical protein